MGLAEFTAIYNYSFPDKLQQEIAVRTYKANEYILTAGE